MEVFKNYGETFRDDNICDAFSLATVLRSLIQKTKLKNDAQRETIELLKKQL